MSQVLTDALLSTTVYFSAVTRARDKSHTTFNTGVSGFSTNMRAVSTTLTDAKFEHHQVFLGSDLSQITHYSKYRVCWDSEILKMSGKLGKASHLHF